jgi:hypothetical protein
VYRYLWSAPSNMRAFACTLGGYVTCPNPAVLAACIARIVRPGVCAQDAVLVVVAPRIELEPHRSGQPVSVLVLVCWSRLYILRDPLPTRRRRLASRQHTSGYTSDCLVTVPREHNLFRRY